MNLIILVASSILLQPVVDDAGEVRLAASETGGEDVEWYVDGVLVATTPSNGATVIVLDEGPHDVWVSTSYDGPWRAVIRPEVTDGPGAITYVDGWSGAYIPTEDEGRFPWPATLFAAGAVLMILAGRRPKRP